MRECKEEEYCRKEKGKEGCSEKEDREKGRP